MASGVSDSAIMPLLPDSVFPTLGAECATYGPDLARQAGIRVANIRSNPSPQMMSVGPQISCAYSGLCLACLPMWAKCPSLASQLIQFTRVIDMAASNCWSYVYHPPAFRLCGEGHTAKTCDASSRMAGF